MASPIITDEELENEKKEVKPKQNLEELMKSMSNEQINEMNEKIDNDILEETEEELKQDIPSSFIEINLASNGRIEGIPKKLHFRDYSASDALDLNVDDDDKMKAIIKVLSRTNYEGFDISKLTTEDVAFILYRIHGTFISNKITKKVYINDKLEGDELNSDDNLEEVDIPISAMKFNYLGKDINDNDLEKKIKVPFTVKDKSNGTVVKFKFTTLNDMLLADTYCRNKYRNEFIKYADIRTAISKINKILDEDEKDKMLDKYLTENEQKCNDYFNFMVEFAKSVAKIVQAEAIVEYNGKPITDLNEQWEIYSTKLSSSIWDIYSDILKEFSFGISDDVEVFIPSLQKKVTRRVGFQFDDFLHIDKKERNDRYTVEFD